MDFNCLSLTAVRSHQLWWPVWLLLSPDCGGGGADVVVVLM
jgi:hypothetical protein